MKILKDKDIVALVQNGKADPSALAKKATKLITAGKPAEQTIARLTLAVAESSFNMEKNIGTATATLQTLTDLLKIQSGSEEAESVKPEGNKVWEFTINRAKNNLISSIEARVKRIE